MKLTPYIICVLLSACANLPVNNNNTTPKGSKKNSSCMLFPANSIWNTAIDSLPIHPLSSFYISSIDAY